jgi:hypothetical protein
MDYRLPARMVLAISLLVSCGPGEPKLMPEEARSIAREAYIYGFPLVDNYRILYSGFVDTADPEYKGPWNEVASVARVFTPEDKTVQTPNSDTPYSMLGADLRTEPLVLTLPAIEKGRYYSAQFIDLYTHNFAYAGSRATGNDGGVFLLAGPNWSGETPAGITSVLRCETELALVVYRTQLFDDRDIDEVRHIQMRYRVQPLSRFLGQSPPPPAPEIDFIAPLSAADERKSLGFFGVLNFVLQFCPTHPSETELMARFGRIGVGAGKTFDAATLEPEIVKAIADGVADAWQAYDSTEQRMATGAIGSGDIFGTREYLKNNYMYRMTAAVDGIYGNSKEEAIYPMYSVDADGQPLNGATGKYTMRFPRNQLPPVNAFWSITMYDAQARLLVANPIERYLINSAMLSKLRKDKDGGLTVYLQYPSPGPGKQSNWLPAPNGPFFVAMRLYWPKPEALDGTWKHPPLERLK